MRRSFLSRGETPDKVYGWHSLINWPTSCRPKIKGGLGILDLERFARALRLRLLWFQWHHKERAWNKLELPCDNTDRELFAASTVVMIGDGKTAKFWTSSWADGRTPMSFAPTLLKKAKRKKLSVWNALQKNRWMSHISPLLTAAEIQEYVLLWEAVQQIHIDTTREDTVIWHWTTDGEYTSKSAYHIQFEGTFNKLRIMPIWKAKAESKCRFFAWTLLHKKILTANNLMKRNWPKEPICKLCGIDPETPTHLCKDCTFSCQVWLILKTWLGLSILDTVNTNGSRHNYWRRCRAKIDKPNKRKFDGLLIYFWWNLRKERNRRTFLNKSLQPREVAFLCKEEFQQFQWAAQPAGPCVRFLLGAEFWVCF